MFAKITSGSKRGNAIWRRRSWLAVAALGCVAIAAIGAALGVNRDALWFIVHGLCVLNETATRNPAPCAKVDLAGGEAKGSAILKDLVGGTQFLLIPTRRVSGVEDPLIGTAALPNYWRAAWAARDLVSARAGKDLPRDAIGMAINAANARSQDQLHIHVDCVRPDVRAALLRLAPKITELWAELREPLAGRLYRARRIAGAEPEPDPFALLAEDARASGARMDQETLAVIGARDGDGQDGFILLAGHSAKAGRAHAETVLDHACALASK